MGGAVGWGLWGRKPGSVHTYGEDPLGLASRAHVGVVDLLEDHPGLVVFAHLRRRETGGRGGKVTAADAETHPFFSTHILHQQRPGKSVSYF